jgi:hypothetical protein
MLVRAANVIAIPVAGYLSLRGTENWTKSQFCVGLVCAAVSLRISLAIRPYHFDEEVAMNQDQEQAKNKRNLKYLLTSCGMITALCLLNTPRVNKLFEAYTHPYVTALIRGIGYGYWCMYGCVIMDDGLPNR